MRTVVLHLPLISPFRYSVGACLDSVLKRQLDCKRIFVGLKLCIHMADIVGAKGSDGVDPLENDGRCLQL
jgi:hypothetical protein